MDKLKDYIKTLLKLAIQNNPEVLKVVRNAKATNLVVQNYNQNQPRVPKGNPNGGQFCGSNKAHYASYNDFVNEFSDYIEDVPEDYEISDVEEVKKDLGVSENQPKIIKTPIEEVELRADRIEHIINGGGDGHLPDKTRYKCINKMLATLERPNIIVSYDNGNKGYYKVFKGENKNKNQVVSIHKDENGDFVYTAMPSDKGSNYFIKQINKGNILYKKAAGTQKNAAVNTIITDNCEDFNPDIKNNEVDNDKWITIKPHGKDSDDYRRLKLEDGETPKEAIERTYGKEEQCEKINQPSLSIAEAKDRAKKIGVKIAKYDDFTPEIADAINEAILTLPKEDIPDYVTSFKEAERLAELTGETKERARKSFGLSWNYPAYRKKDDNTYINTDTNVYFNQKYKKLEQISKKKKDYNNSREKPWYFNTDGKSVFYHEIGHQYERKHGLDDEFKKLADDWANSTQYQNIKKIEYGRVKEGAGANYKEAFAEAWAAYHTQNKELPKNVHDYIHRLNSQIKRVKLNNNKEQDMALLDELKKLITKVENDKGENMDKKQRIMNILNSANVDEDVKKEVENELDKQDDKPIEKADNEKQEDPKKEPTDNPKVENENGKSEEKVNELKKDVKEDAQNKCNNSVDNSKGSYFDKMNEIYNAAIPPAEENTYISREQKLKNAEAYFAK